MKKGFTLIELLLVIAIIAIIGSLATPFLSRFVTQTHFDSTVEKIVSSLRRSQEYAMDGKNGASWGVCMSGNTIRLYSGTCGSPASSEEFSVPGSVTVSDLSDITFSNRGEPSNTLSISVSTAIESLTIGLNRAGGLSYD